MQVGCLSRSTSAGVANRQGSGGRASTSAGKLPAGVTPVGLTSAEASGGYWILASNGGVSNFHAPWHGSLAGKLRAGQTVTGIAGD